MRVVGNLAGTGPLHQVIMDTVSYARLLELTSVGQLGIPTWYEAGDIGVGRVLVNTSDPHWFENFKRQVQDGRSG